jgi:uncharacterized protein YerC
MNTDKDICIVSVTNETRYETYTHTFVTLTKLNAYIRECLQDFFDDCDSIGHEDDLAMKAKVAKLLQDGEIDEAFNAATEHVGDSGWDKTAFGYFEFKHNKDSDLAPLNALLTAATADNPDVQEILDAAALCRQFREDNAAL